MLAYMLNFYKNFDPLYGYTIDIPSNVIMWRGYDPKYPAISERPAYYGAIEFAQGYAEKYNTLAQPFITTRQLRLLDIRYMKVLLTQLCDAISSNKYTKEDTDIIIATSISFGLCSLKHQIKLFKHRYKAIYLSNDPMFEGIKNGIKNLESILNENKIVEQRGVRIADTTNDAIVMGFLKELFNHTCDGYIAPNIESAFHIEKNGFILNSEIILFNPIHSGIKQLKLPLPNGIKEITVQECIVKSNLNYTTINTRNIKTTYFNGIKKGGGKINPDDYNNLYNNGDKNIIKLYNKGSKIGRKWNNYLRSAIARHPEVPIEIFSNSGSNEYNYLEIKD
jgi:hypothetical protein